MGYLYLAGAIVSEVFGSTMLKLTSMTNKKGPVFGIFIGYFIAFYLLSVALLTIPLSFSYAVWSGAGTALTAVVGFMFFKEQMTPKTITGILLLIVGIVLMKV